MALVQVVEAPPPRDRLTTERAVRPLDVMSFTAQLKPERMLEVVPVRPSKTLTEIRLVRLATP